MTRTPPDVFGMTTSGLEYGEVECWIRPAAKYWPKMASTSLAMMGLMRCGLDVTGVLASGTKITKGINEQEQKSDLDFEKTSGNLQSTPPICSMASGVQSVPRRPKATARRCRQTCPDAQVRSALVWAQTLKQCRRGRGWSCEGEAVTGETGDTSDRPGGGFEAGLPC